MVKTEIPSAWARQAPVTSCMPAPAAIRPSAIEAEPMQQVDSVVPAQAGGPRRMVSQQAGRQPQHGGDDQRIAQQLAAHGAPPRRAIGPHGGDVVQRHADADQHRHQLQALGAGQRSATARPMNELKRNATCALAAWS